MDGAPRIARAAPQVGNIPRSNEGDAEARAPATGILTLSRPQNGVVSTFDAQDYAVIDFISIDNQWAALVQVGRTLQIVFKNGAIIELLNFFSYNSAYGASSDEDHTGTVPGGPVEPLLQTSASQMLSLEEFVQTYWITKSSGTFLIDPLSELRNGEQALGAETGLHPSDTPPLPILPDLSQPIFPLVVPPPQPPLPPPVPPTLGTNSPAVITGPVTGAVVEAGGVNNGTPGTPTATGDLKSTDVDNQNDAWTAVNSPTASASGYGTYTLTTAGVWIYTLDNSNAAVQALNVGGTLTDTFTVATIDGTSQVVTITINGANDAPVIAGPVTGTVVEAGGVANGTPGTPTATGDLNSSDVDNPSDAWTAVDTATASADGYGAYTLTAAGVWSYTLDNSNAAVQALNVGGTLTDTFTVATVDGTSQVVTITINGANDAPVAVADSNAGDAVVESGVGPGNTPFAGDPSAAGNVLTNDIDVDSGDTRTVTAVSGSAQNVGQPLVGTYGTLTLLANGTWSYVLNNADPETDALAQGQTATDVFTYTMADANGATSSTSLTITITGTNDAPVVTAAVDNGTVTEGPLPLMTADGTIDFGDVDLADAHVTSVTPGASGYLGTFAATVNNDSTGDGVGQVTWLFAATNQLRQLLGAGQQLVQTYTVEIDDGHGGTATQLVTITINGTNDAAVITGDTTGTVVEAGGVNNGAPGTPTATGDLNSTDVDDPADAWTAVNSPAASTNGYGTYTLTAAGVWTYTLDNSNPAVQALNVGQTLTDTFTAITVDGTEQLVTITIDGANDAAVITGPVIGTVVEAGGVNNGTPGTPIATGNLNSTDVDNPNDAWTAVGAAAASANGYGSYTLTADGVWTYTLDNSNATVQALNAGQTLTDSFTATTVDGTARLVTVTINGANDDAVITGVASGSVTEAGGVNNGTPGTPIATGNLNSTDVDNPPDTWTAVGTATASTDGYGTYTLTAAGVWSYTLNNANATVQALNAGQTLTDSVHRRHHRRHRAGGDHHHQRRQRCRGDHRDRDRSRDRSRRGQQRHASAPRPRPAI